VTNGKFDHPIVLPPDEKVKGISIREVWKFKIEDEKLIPREYLSVDESKIGQVVRALKDATNIPGILVYAEKQVNAGGRL